MMTLAALTVPALLTNASALLLMGATNRHSAHQSTLLHTSMLLLQFAASSFGITTGLMMFGAEPIAEFGAGLGLGCLTFGVLLLSLESALAMLRRRQALRRNTSAK